MIHYTRASLYSELQQILLLQDRNVKRNTSPNEQHQEGFVTVGHTFEILKKMNDACPHIIAKDGEIVVGYALVMLPGFETFIEVLKPLFGEIQALWNKRQAIPQHLQNAQFIVMGQIAIDKPYRRQGIFKGLYSYYREELRNTFDCVFTEVATSNIRSLEAHKAVGFEVVKTKITDGTSWEIICWDW